MFPLSQYIISAGLQFNVTAASIKPAVDALQANLNKNPVNVPINLKITNSTNQQVQNQITKINALSKAVTGLSSSSGAASANLNELAKSLVRVGVGISQATAQNKQLNATNKQLQNIGTSTTSVVQASTRGIGSMTDFASAVGLAAKRFTSFVVAASAVTGVAYKFVEAIKEAVDFNFQMVRLKQVGKDAPDVLDSISKAIGRISTGLGVSSKDLVQSAVTLRQAGLSAYETKVALETLAKTTLAPTFKDINNTTEGMISILGILKTDVGQLEKQFGSINRVAADFAVESSDIIEAWRRSGAAFKAAGGDLHEFIGLFTAVRSTTRESAETIAAGFRTIFARSERGDTIARLKGLGVELQKIPGQFVGPMQAVKNLYDVLGKEPAGSLKLAKVVEEVGGIRQFEKLIPLIQEFPLAMKAYQASLKGGNSLNEDATIAQESLINKLTKLKESFLELFRILSQNTGVLAVFEGMNRLLQGTISLVKTLEPLVVPLIAGLALKGAIAAPAAFGRFKTAFTGGGYGNVTGRAKGGPIAASDTVPAMLTPGEFVIRKEAAQKIGYGNLHHMNSVGMAGGGKVGKRGIIEMLKKMLGISASKASSLYSDFNKSAAGQLYDAQPYNSPFGLPQAAVGYGVEKAVKKIRGFAGGGEIYDFASSFSDPLPARYQKQQREKRRHGYALAASKNRPTAAIEPGPGGIIYPNTGGVSYRVGKNTNEPHSGYLAGMNQSIRNPAQYPVDWGAVNRNIDLPIINRHFNMGPLALGGPPQSSMAALPNFSPKALPAPAIPMGAWYQNSNAPIAMGGTSDWSNPPRARLFRGVQTTHDLTPIRENTNWENIRNQLLAEQATKNIRQPNRRLPIENTAPIGGQLPARRQRATYRGPLIPSSPAIAQAGYEARNAGLAAAQYHFTEGGDFYNPPETTAAGSRARGGYGANGVKYKQPYLTRSSRSVQYNPAYDKAIKDWRKATLPGNTVTDEQFREITRRSRSTPQYISTPGNRAMADYSEALGNQAYRRPKKGGAFLSRFRGTSQIGSVGNMAVGGGGKPPNGPRGGFGGTGGFAAIAAAEALPYFSEKIFGGAKNPGAYSRGASAFSGAVAGGTTGALLGSSFGPHGAAIGGIVGALAGAVGSLKNFDEELKNINLEKFNDQINKAIQGFDPLTGKFKNAQQERNFNEGINKLAENNTLPSLEELAKRSEEGSSRIIPQIDKNGPIKYVQSASNRRTSGSEVSGGSLGGLEEFLNSFRDVDAEYKKKIEDTKTAREVLEKQIKDIFQANAGLGSKTSLEKAAPYLEKLKNPKISGPGGFGLEQQLRKQEIANQNVAVAIADTVSKIFDMTIAVEELGNRTEKAAELFERNMDNMGIAGEALGGRITGSKETPMLGMQEGLAGQLGRFSMAGGGYDQAHQAMMNALKMTVKHGGSVQSPETFAENTFLQNYKGDYAPEAAAGLKKFITEQKMNLPGVAANLKASADKALEGVRPFKTGGEQLQKQFDHVFRGYVGKQAELANRDFDITKRTNDVMGLNTNALQGVGVRNTELRNIRGTLGDYRGADINAREVIGMSGLGSKLKSLTGSATADRGSITTRLGEQQAELAKTISDQATKGVTKEGANHIIELNSKIAMTAHALEVLAADTTKVTAAQERYALATEKLNGEINARRNDAATFTFGSRQERMQLMQKEALVQQTAHLTPQQFSMLPDDVRATVGERLNETLDVTRDVPVFNKNRDRIVKFNQFTGRQQRDALARPAEQFVGLGQNGAGGFANPNIEAIRVQAEEASKQIFKAQSEQSAAQLELLKVQRQQIEVERTQNFVNLKNFQETFKNSVTEQYVGFMEFSKASAELTSVLATNPIPNKIELTQNGQIQVLINGAETIRAIKGDLSTSITATVIAEIKRQLPIIIRNMPH